jgi:hypothetical protein
MFLLYLICVFCHMLIIGYKLNEQKEKAMKHIVSKAFALVEMRGIPSASLRSHTTPSLNPTRLQYELRHSLHNSRSGCHAYARALSGSIPLLMTETKIPSFRMVFFMFGGDEGDRTPCLLNAIQALSQVSYTPIFRYLQIHKIRDSFWSCFLPSYSLHT